MRGQKMDQLFIMCVNIFYDDRAKFRGPGIYSYFKK